MRSVEQHGLTTSDGIVTQSVRAGIKKAPHMGGLFGISKVISARLQTLKIPYELLGTDSHISRPYVN